MNYKQLRLHHYEPLSRSNGPGLRSVVWVQGCNLKCPGCFNPETHSTMNGEYIYTKILAEKIISNANHIDGVTISGGEPIMQYPSIIELLQLIKSRTNYSVILFSGYEWYEIIKNKKISKILDFLDVIITGRFDQSQRYARSLKGSKNKEMHFLTERYNPSNFDDLAHCEITIDSNGNIRMSGIDPLHLTNSVENISTLA